MSIETENSAYGERGKRTDSEPRRAERAAFAAWHDSAKKHGSVCAQECLDAYRRGRADQRRGDEELLNLLEHVLQECVSTHGALVLNCVHRDEARAALLRRLDPDGQSAEKPPGGGS